MRLISNNVNLEDLTADDLKGVDYVSFRFTETLGVAWFEFENTGVRWKLTTYVVEDQGVNNSFFPRKYLPDAKAVVDCVNQLFDVFCDNYAQVDLVLQHRGDD